MPIRIGIKIKELRQTFSVSQSDLAEYLGVTPQAISRWENDTCYPDIQLLPAIADFFDISTDELLCVDKIKSEKQISDYLTQASALSELKKYHEIIPILRCALEEHPNSLELKAALAHALMKQGNPTHIPEACDLCKRILQNPRSTEEQKGQAQHILCTIYTFQLHDEAKSYEIIQNMPSWNYSRELFLSHYMSNSHLQQQKNLKWLVDQLWHIMHTFCTEDTTAYSVQEKIMICQKNISLLELIFDEDYKYYCTRISTSYFILAQLSLSYSIAIDIVVSYLEKAWYYARQYDQRPAQENYTSVLLRDVTYYKHQYIENKEHTECFYLKQQLQDPFFDSIRSHVTFLQED